MFAIQLWFTWHNATALWTSFSISGDQHSPWCNAITQWSNSSVRNILHSPWCNAITQWSNSSIRNILHSPWCNAITRWSNSSVRNILHSPWCNAITQWTKQWTAGTAYIHRKTSTHLAWHDHTIKKSQQWSTYILHTDSPDMIQSRPNQTWCQSHGDFF